MNTISELAKEIRDAKVAAGIIAADKKRAEVREQLAFLHQEFAIAFSEMLPILEASGIAWEACLQNEDYRFMGSYILFKKGDKTLKMDFSNRDSYRYEFQSYDQKGYGKSAYGKWDMERFILFLDEEL